MVNGERWEAAEEGSAYLADADVVRVDITNAAEGVTITFRTFS